MLAGIHCILPDSLKLYVHAHHTCLQKKKCTDSRFVPTFQFLYGIPQGVQFSLSVCACIFLKILEVCISGTKRYMCTIIFLYVVNGEVYIRVSLCKVGEEVGGACGIKLQLVRTYLQGLRGHMWKSLKSVSAY
jgi:hypothetical protein